MGWRNEIDVVASPILKAYHNFRQDFITDFFAIAKPGNVTVLAVNTFQIAIGEKDGSGSHTANQGRLFTKMRIK
jgi:hypothetical protein